MHQTAATNNCQRSTILYILKVNNSFLILYHDCQTTTVLYFYLYHEGGYIGKFMG